MNQPAPPPFKESVRCAEQNLYARAKELVGDREPRQHEFSVQLRAFDSAKSGSAVGVGVLLALCSSLLQKSIKGGLAVSGGLKLGAPRASQLEALAGRITGMDDQGKHLGRCVFLLNRQMM
ncbi:MAG: hypothetical protein JWQ21_624 [Herminiimonas sp.]|nr:hypothetical protein [Herminiimonas sp.]